MDFIGINQFGALTSKISKVMINFEDLDLDGDGKISEEEFSKSIFNDKDGGFDTVEFSTVDKSNDKEISQEEFEIFEQERKMEELVAGLNGQIATDFIGANSSLVPEVKSALKDFIKEFSEEYRQSGEKIKNMASAFAEVLASKYEDIKADILEESETKSESFWDVKRELDENVPDRTTTKSEKALALEYIDRMLACDDIPNEAKIFWTKQRAIIEEEMKHCLPDDAQKIVNEWREFTDKYWKDGWFPNDDARIKYFETYISYMSKILACKDVPEEYRKEYTRMKQNATRDLNNTLKESDEPTSYYDVYTRFVADIPDTNDLETLEEKELAISYIELMLSCKDTPKRVRIVWEGVIDIIKRDIREMKSETTTIFG